MTSLKLLASASVLAAGALAGCSSTDHAGMSGLLRGVVAGGLGEGVHVGLASSCRRRGPSRPCRPSSTGSLTGMIKHHHGAVTMAHTDLDRRQNPDAKKLAQTSSPPRTPRSPR
jgi:hypothetical protein